MNKFKVNFKRLALLLLPPFLRRPVMASLMYSVITPLGFLHTRFMQFREEANYRLNHNGQVCYLRAVLNDTFDPYERRITVTDTAENSGILLLHKREQEQTVFFPVRNAGLLLVNRRGFGGVSGYDFIVNIPFALRSIDSTRMRAVVATYKLVSKRFSISYF